MKKAGAGFYCGRCHGWRKSTHSLRAGSLRRANTAESPSSNTTACIRRRSELFPRASTWIGGDLSNKLQFGKTAARFSVLCAQYPRKHIVDLLLALPKVLREVPDARAVIVGDGPEHSKIQESVARLKLESSVTLLQNMPDDDEVARQYCQADIFCLPSHQEGFGIVFLEAMVTGLPIVSTTAAAIPELVPHGKAGFLVSPGDVDALAAALVELLLKPELRQAYGDFGRECVKQYDWKTVALEFLNAVGFVSSSS